MFDGGVAASLPVGKYRGSSGNNSRARTVLKVFNDAVEIAIFNCGCCYYYVC